MVVIAIAGLFEALRECVCVCVCARACVRSRAVLDLVLVFVCLCACLYTSLCFDCLLVCASCAFGGWLVGWLVGVNGWVQVCAHAPFSYMPICLTNKDAHDRRETLLKMRTRQQKLRSAVAYLAFLPCRHGKLLGIRSLS